MESFLSFNLANVLTIGVLVLSFLKLRHDINQSHFEKEKENDAKINDKIKFLKEERISCAASHDAHLKELEQRLERDYLKKEIYYLNSDNIKILIDTQFKAIKELMELKFKEFNGRIDQLSKQVEQLLEE